MITAQYYLEYMRKNKENGDVKNAVKDTVAVLKQYGYDMGADILADMLCECNKDETKGE